MAESGMRWEQAAAEICEAVENSAAKIARNAADNLYETVMVAVQDYLRENVEFNLSSKLQGYADTANRLRAENEQLKRRADLVEPLVEALRGMLSWAEARPDKHPLDTWNAGRDALAAYTAAQSGQAQTEARG